jgi:hypothetical protein
MSESAALEGNPPVVSDRLAILVGALLGVRTDHASARFDAELGAALTTGRVDVQTARALRFSQRASVQAVEEYIGAVLPAAFNARDAADRQGSLDAAEATAAWQAAQAAQAARAQAVEPTDAAEPSRATEATQLTRRLISLRDSGTQHRSAKETEQAVRAALQFEAVQFDAVQFEGKDSGHARSATSA